VENDAGKAQVLSLMQTLVMFSLATIGGTAHLTVFVTCLSEFRSFHIIFFVDQ